MKFEDVKVGIPYLLNEDNEVILFVTEKTDDYIKASLWMRVDFYFKRQKINKGEQFDYYLQFLRPAPSDILHDTIKELWNEI